MKQLSAAICIERNLWLYSILPANSTTCKYWTIHNVKKISKAPAEIDGGFKYFLLGFQFPG